MEEFCRLHYVIQFYTISDASQLIWSANQLTGFYVMGTLVINVLSELTFAGTYCFSQINKILYLSVYFCWWIILIKNSQWETVTIIWNLFLAQTLSWKSRKQIQKITYIFISKFASVYSGTNFITVVNYSRSSLIKDWRKR